MSPPLDLAKRQLPLLTSARADPPDDTGARDLNQRTVGGHREVRVRARITHRAIVGNPGATVWSKPDVGRTVERIDVVGDERLVARGIAGELHDLELNGPLALPREVDQLDLVADLVSEGRGRR